MCEIFCNRGKRVATWSSRCASLYAVTHSTISVQCVCFDFNTDQKNTYAILLKNVDYCVLSNISIVAISVGLPVAVNNPVPASQIGFQQFHAI